MTALGTTSAATEGRVSTCQWLRAVPAGKFTLYLPRGHEIVVNGGANGGDTCSSVSCGTVSVDNSDKHPSVAFVFGDSVTVNCNEGYSVDRRHLGVTP